MPPPTNRPAHRHTESTPAIVTQSIPSPEQTQKTSRLMSSVRRTLGKRRDPAPNSATLYSTPSERMAQVAFRYDTPATAPRPTIEQIAMGLHRSRTPHLRGAPKYPAPASHPQPTRTPVPLPPPPPRSSLKKPQLGLVSNSSTDVTSTAPSTPHSSDRSSASLRARMSRFLPRGTHRTIIGPVHLSDSASPASSASELPPPLPRKKAVRFSSTVEEDD
ncbi:hypothetical protein DFH07DRAFT_328018 [Mycena maculata]|uniref:Uncharacterized protein n=1 Tax=Mycena maculata TaxID=230809 RepID=A0AAD7NM23_9AGAR|nr:hypothetical protein DFH07DRAFT_328018 [Mycena maculata]